MKAIVAFMVDLVFAAEGSYNRRCNQELLGTRDIRTYQFFQFFLRYQQFYTFKTTYKHSSGDESLLNDHEISIQMELYKLKEMQIKDLLFSKLK